MIAMVTRSFATTDSLFALPINSGAISTSSAGLYFRIKVSGDSTKPYLIRCIIDSMGLGIATWNDNGVGFGTEDTVLVNFVNLTPSTYYKIVWYGLYDLGTDTLITAISPIGLGFTTKINDTLAVVNDVKVDPTTDGFRIIVNSNQNGNDIDLIVQGMNILSGPTNGQTSYQFSGYVPKNEVSYSNKIDTFFIKDMPSCVSFEISIIIYYHSGARTNWLHFHDTFRTLCKPGVPTGLKAYSGCKEVGLEQFYVDVVPNDTTTLYFSKKDTALNTWVLVDSMILTKSQMIGKKTVSVAENIIGRSMARDLRVQTKSKDNIWSQIYPIRATASTGSAITVPAIQSITENTASAVIKGNLACINVAYLEYKLFEASSGILVSSQKKQIGSFSPYNVEYFGEVFGLNNLKPATTYHLTTAIYMSDSTKIADDEIYFMTKGTPAQSSIHQTSLDQSNWSDDQLVRVYTMTGQFIGEKRFSELHTQLTPDQIYILLAEIDGVVRSKKYTYH